MHGHLHTRPKSARLQALRNLLQRRRLLRMRTTLQRLRVHAGLRVLLAGLFACGCAKPRTVKVLTKYHAEKEIGWYHWEVVDAECCDCVAQIGENGDIATKASDGCLYKPAPADAALGKVLAVTKEELSDMESVLKPAQEVAAEPEQSEVAVVEQAGPQPEDAAMPSEAEPEVSIAERLGRLFK